MPIKTVYTNSYLMTIATSDLSVTIMTFAVEICMTLIMSKCDTLFVANSNVCPIYQRLRDIDRRYVHDLDLGL